MINQLKQDQNQKVTHGYNQKSIRENPDLDQLQSVAWLRKLNLSSHMKGYLLAMNEQEIVTKTTAKRRGKDPTKRRQMDSRCRPCRKGEETLHHILASCEEVSSSLFLTYRHNRMGKVVYEEILKAEGEKKTPWNVIELARIGDKELWWDKSLRFQIK